ncbi:helix-turn-helix domain-containing protein [Desulfopila sp. IMCC35008]|uniref:helix-turn-helix domain-containing protein n=1 Tax=Desulfopila sp. IMCC35008 TaxID=2653858 RepID=UPI0013CFABE6|nr:helix-turn-helix domain-containing protein [Desulfopila sp. IMCC35008]
MMKEIDSPKNSNLRCIIVQTARELFDSQGFDNTTVHDLVDRLDISDSLFCAYFKSLDELLEIVWSEL